jgi:hypothetical protein
MKAIVFVIVAASAVLAGCTVKETVVKPAEPAPPPVVYQQPPATTGAPRVAYAVMGQSQYDQAATLANTWCVTNHYVGARMIDRQRGTGGDVVTFECTAG